VTPVTQLLVFTVRPAESDLGIVIQPFILIGSRGLSPFVSPADK